MNCCYGNVKEEPGLEAYGIKNIFLGKRQCVGCETKKKFQQQEYFGAHRDHSEVSKSTKSSKNVNHVTGVLVWLNQII